MAVIIVGSYMVRFPMGGMISWVLQYLVGFKRLGHEVYFVEKSGYPNACFVPIRHVMTDDCSYGATTVNKLLSRFSMESRWCYVDASEKYHGMTKNQIEEVFRSADLFVDMGTHGAWMREARHCGLRVLLDGEPGFNQMKMEHAQAAGQTLPEYDFYFTNGRNVGTSASTAPTAGRTWRHVYHPVVTELFPFAMADPAAPFTTVMNWQTHEHIHFAGKTYGQKSMEFEKFLDLPRRVTRPMEIAVGGKAPKKRLENAGWHVRDAHSVTMSFDSFQDYIASSAAEFTVCKNVFVETNSGWFSDRSAAYLAAGRPVVIEETGFSASLPCGEGLFAVSSVEEAVDAIRRIDADYPRHSRKARELAREHLDATKVMGRFLEELGI